MATFRTLDEIALAMLDFLRLVQPDLDTKPGGVVRDVLVDPTAAEVAKLYNELRNISNLQSLASATGSDLERLAQNFGQVRSTGSPASGTVYLTSNDLTSDTFVPAGTILQSQGGQSFATLIDVSFNSSRKNVYKANASRIRSELDLAGITDEYALEVAVEATQAGTSGNIGKFAINRSTISGISHAVNLTSFTGGTSSETDIAFRSRVLGIFAGSNIGTTLGYINTLLADPRVASVLAVEPGDTLMIRDGTITGVNSNGEPVIISSGTGGKVDLYLQGSSLESFSESFIYRDQSGRSDPTDAANDYILGQRSINPLLDFQQKRKLLLGKGTLPFQPVESVVSVGGSLSGPNFAEAFTNSSGQIEGNFELVKDEGAFGGSPFGFDRIHWISNQIALPDESSSKGPLNSQDPLDFTGINKINAVRQEVVITNENSKVDTSDRSIITLNHTPVITTTRVDNLSTGERYTVVNQNVDGGAVNATGRIKISGGTLPTSTDVLQVSYIWDLYFDEDTDYDNLQFDVFTRTVQDSIDWGFANKVEAEEEEVLWSVDDGYHVIVEHPISRVVNVNTWTEESVVNAAGKLVVADTILNIRSITAPGGQEVFYTLNNNGSFSAKEITLPTDTVLLNGQTAIVRYNSSDIYSTEGSFSGSVIYIPDDVIENGATVYVDYVADVSSMLPTTTLNSLPAEGDGNNFVVLSEITGNQPISNEFVGGDIERSLRFSPSHLKMLVQGISATGRLTVRGTSFTRIKALVLATRNGLTIDLSQVIRNHFKLQSVPSSMYVAYVSSAKKVSVSGGQATTTNFVFDTLNYTLKNNTYSNGTSIENASLTTSEFGIAPTGNNTSASPQTGEWLEVVFYVADTNAAESITVSSSGTKITKNKYAFVNSISLNSGFVSSSGTVEGTVSVQMLTQPVDGSTYFVSYSYTAPKDGERIIVNYNFNRLINDATFKIENVRPVTADVLVKAASTIAIDVGVIITPLPGFGQGSEILRQNAQETITGFLTGGGLNATVDASDIVNVLYSVNGVDRVEMTRFNENGETGVVRSLVSGRDHYFTAGVITVSVEAR